MSTENSSSQPDERQMKKLRKSASRLYAVQALFQMEHSSQSVDQVRAEFLNFRFGAEIEEGTELLDGDINLFRSLLEEAVNWQAKIDQMTDRALVAKWPIARIDPTLRALFRAAGSELIAHETPPKVVIVEFVEIAKAFYPEGREPKFVNAVLDHMAREAKPEAF
ncbi:MAG: transcription antitermination factor NusB [Pseudomonadota bacterium]|uniref:Transcription antitermination protein NusB n=1 Tax=Thalassococcus halodurans TaxID=373675 RepID=A0A1H5SVJ5_9RHOB|nr:transcription antitermination factor NusB [Thalassococcus halodurans]MEC8581150.1 transcription antitermination factor NusB [Pseudomonadota bacterium]SEF54550.1 NusB antitermination factor [Thalassococcus halodurans]